MGVGSSVVCNRHSESLDRSHTYFVSYRLTSNISRFLHPSCPGWKLQNQRTSLRSSRLFQKERLETTDEGATKKRENTSLLQPRRSFPLAFRGWSQTWGKPWRPPWRRRGSSRRRRRWRCSPRRTRWSRGGRRGRRHVSRRARRRSGRRRPTLSRSEPREPLWRPPRSSSALRAPPPLCRSYLLLRLHLRLYQRLFRKRGGPRAHRSVPGNFTRSVTAPKLRSVVVAPRAKNVPRWVPGEGPDSRLMTASYLSTRPCAFAVRLSFRIISVLILVVIRAPADDPVQDRSVKSARGEQSLVVRVPRHGCDFLLVPPERVYFS